MVQIQEIIIVIMSIYTFISESLPFIKDIESNGIMHFLILFINKYQITESNIEQPNDIERLNLRCNQLEVTFNTDLKNLKTEIDSRLNYLEINN